MVLKIAYLPLTPYFRIANIGPERPKKAKILTLSPAILKLIVGPNYRETVFKDQIGPLSLNMALKIACLPLFPFFWIANIGWELPKKVQCHLCSHIIANCRAE